MNRLNLISSLTSGYDVIADIGSDHGYVCIEAILKYNVSYAYSCDINEGPLKNALNNIKQRGLENKIKTIQSDGLKNFNEACDCIVISGMGGTLIKKILEESFNKLDSYKCLILQPNNDEPCVRKFLFDNKYIIKKEFIIKENNHFYEIMVFIKGENNYNDLDINFGPLLRLEKNNIFKEKYEKKINVLSSNLSNIKDKNVLNNLKNKINYIKGVLYE